MAAKIYAVYEQVRHGKEVHYYRVRTATAQSLRAEGFYFLPHGEVMQKEIYGEPGYHEALVAYPRRWS